MKNKDRILLSLFAAIFSTMLHIGWRKFGGLVSGGRYSDSHTWTELYDFIPEFLFVFTTVFIFFYIMQRMGAKQIYVKCPKCEKIKESLENIEVNCPECGVKFERLEGFFERHPEK